MSIEKCKKCGRKFRKNARKGKTVTFLHIPSNEKITLTAFKDMCYFCAKNEYTNWIKKHNLKMNGRFQKEFWIYHFPEYKNKIENRSQGKGSLQHYLNTGRTEKDYKEKNKLLSVGYNTLKRKGLSESEIKEIKDKHSKKSAINLENLIRIHGKKEGTQRYISWLLSSRKRSIWCKEYWVKKGYTIKEAEEKISKLQIRDKHWFIKKYGTEVGLKKYKECCRKKAVTLDNYISKYGNKLGKEKFNKVRSNKTYSNLEYNFFKDLAARYKKKKNVFWGDNQWKFGLRKSEWKYYNKKVFYIDFLDKDKKKIIEFNGDFFHANKLFFAEDDICNPFNKLTAKEIWENDRRRYEFYTKLGYKYLIVWENDIKNNYEETLEKCLDFLKGGNYESNKKTS